MREGVVQKVGLTYFSGGPFFSFILLKKEGKPALSYYNEKSGLFNVLVIGSDARKGDKASHTEQKGRITLMDKW